MTPVEGFELFSKELPAVSGLFDLVDAVNVYRTERAGRRGARWRRARLQTAAGRAYIAWQIANEAAGDVAHLHWRTVDAVLNSEAARQDDAATMAGGAARDDSENGPRTRLAHALRDAARVLRAELGMVGPWPATEEEALATLDTGNGPALAWDVRFAGWLDERYGAKMEGAPGEGTRTRARARWQAWTGEDGQTHIEGAGPVAGDVWAGWCTPQAAQHLETLALILWRVDVRPWWAEEQAKRERAPLALVLPFAEDLARMHASGGRIWQTPGGPALVDRKGQTLAMVRQAGGKPEQTIGAVSIDAIPELASRGAGLMGTLTAHRLVRWAAREAHGRVLAGDPDARVLHVDGGWRSMAEQIGAKSKKAEEQLPAIVAAGALLWWPAPDGDGGGGNLWAATVQRAQGHGRARVELTLGTMLLPYYGIGQRGEHKALVPLIDMPPMVGRERDHGAQAAMQLLTLAAIRRRARELVNEGGVALEWLELAGQAGVSEALLPRVLDRWTQDGDDGPAFLQRQGNRYTLGNAYTEARNYMVAAGERELNGAARQKQGREKKEKARTGASYRPRKK